MNSTFAILSLLAAIVPVSFYLIVIWKLDRYDREPIWLVSLNFFWGGIGAIVFGFFGSQFLLKNIIPLFMSSVDEKVVSAVMVAPLVEELAKGLFLLFVTSPMKDFDNMTDGVVYGASIGLGFGMTENFLYFMTEPTVMSTWLETVFSRSILTAVMHACSTACFGAFVGYAKFHAKGNKSKYIIFGMILAMIIHAFWNYSVVKLDLIRVGAVFIFIAVVLIGIAFFISLRTESRMIARELAEESDFGTIPKDHLKYLPHTKLRNRKGWLPPEVDHQRYLKIATTLAFRKLQSRNCPENKKAFYEQEIEYARAEISYLLNNTLI